MSFYADYKFDSSFFTTDDIRHMMVSLKISDHIGPRYSNASSDIMAKLALISSELTSLYEDDLQNYFHIDIIEKTIRADTSTCQTINACLEDEHYTRISGTMTVAPICYVVKPDGLWLFAYEDHPTSKYRLFSVEDMTSVEMTEEAFEWDFMTYDHYKAMINEI